ncbi:hypothetical protein BGZ63DRAFT_220928 [Mariannaea sp. PMI_226]|nr:hypothetical protein BGZ63DRAFT_220928 [Mariannaea sp. PMI_226]
MQPWPLLFLLSAMCETYAWRGRKTRYLRENEAVTVEPLGVLGVELHELVEEDVGNGSHSPLAEMSVNMFFLWRFIARSFS